MRVLVTGASGLLGGALVRALEQSGHRVWAMDRGELDITNAEAVQERIQLLRPDVVANCAAFTAVDDCETQSERAFRVNALGARNVAVACHESGSAMLHISTDQIFDGKAIRPYQEWAAAAPVNQYGASKLAGEQMVRAVCPRHWIVRTQWLFGAGGANIVRSILHLAAQYKELSVVQDQVGSPTYAPDLAGALVQLMGSPRYGTYHITNSGSCSHYDFARLILATIGRSDIIVRPQLTAATGRPAPRPMYTVLDNCLWRAERRSPLRSYAMALQEFLQTEAARRGETARF